MATKTTSFTGPVVVGLNDKKGEIRLTDGKNVNEAKYLAIAAPDTITSDTTLTFPNGTGTAGQILSTDGSGTLSWVNDSAGNPDGSNGQVQFNDNGTFGAIPDGTAGQVLKSNGAGAAPSFQTDATNSPGGSNTEMQFNDNGSFGAISNGTAGQVLKSNGAGAAPSFQTDSTGIAAVVDDTTPQLGGNLDLNSFTIQGTGNLDIANGTIKLDGNYPTGTNNVAMGDTALDSIGVGGSGHNVAIGHAALTADFTGTGNVGIGAFALTSTVTGNYSTAIGQEALKVNTASSNNAIGFQSMLTSVGGEKNIAMGFWSLKNLGSNDKNVAIGHEAGINLTGGDNNIIIGHNAQAASATTSNQITLGDANITSLRIPGLQSGASANDILTFNGTDITLAAPAGGGGGLSWQPVITGVTVAAASQGFFVNTSGGAVTLILPATPTQGDEVAFVDYAGTAATNNITISRNGENIQGSASDLIINTNRAANTLVYADATQGWLLKNV